MRRQTFILISLTTLLTLACSTISELTSAPTQAVVTRVIVEDKPLSTFVPAREVIQVPVNEPVEFETYHASDLPIASLVVAVNGQTDFPANLASVEIIEDGQVIGTTSATPIYPTSTWPVRVRWIGRVPGTYELSLVATNAEGEAGDPVVQQIEVQ